MSCYVRATACQNFIRLNIRESLKRGGEIPEEYLETGSTYSCIRSGLLKQACV